MSAQGRIRRVKLSRRKVLVPKEKPDASAAGTPPSAATKTDARIGSPGFWLALIGTLTPEEGAALRASAQEFE